MNHKIHANVPLGNPRAIDSIIPECREIQRSIESYQVQSFTERQNPHGAFRSQQIQGESYVAAGFVYPTGLDEYGRLLPELDRSRGDHVKYKLATSINGDPDDQAALRIIEMEEGHKLDDIAAYRYSKDTLYEGATAILEEQVATHGASSLKEVSALAKSNKAGDLSSFELIRHIVQEAVCNDTQEMWLIAFAQPAFDAIQKNFGPSSLTQIGDAVQVDVGDARTSDTLRLIPTIIRPCEVLDGLLRDIDMPPTDDTDPRQQMRYVRTLMFLADGIKQDEMSAAVHDRVDFVNSMINAHSENA